MNIKEWTAALIALSAAAAVLLPLVPKTGTGRLMRLIVSLCFLSMLIWPLTQLSEETLPELAATDFGERSSAVDEKLREQVERQVNAVLTEKANEALKGYRLQLKKAVADVDIDGENGICIKRIVIYPDRKSRESPSTLILVLNRYFGVEVVMADDG